MMKIRKKEAMFFHYFSEMVDMANEAAVELENMLMDYTNVDEKINKISQIEHNCDQQVHMIIEKLNQSFITPIDREDIFLIVKHLDNIVDYIEESAHRFVIFNVKEIKPGSIEIAKIITKSTEDLKKLFNELINMKVNSNLNDAIISINNLENQGDHIYREELTKLFANEENPIDIIRWQGIYTYLERALDSCEDVANAIEGVVMKHA